MLCPDITEPTDFYKEVGEGVECQRTTGDSESRTENLEDGVNDQRTRVPLINFNVLHLRDGIGRLSGGHFNFGLTVRIAGLPAICSNTVLAAWRRGDPV